MRGQGPVFLRRGSAAAAVLLGAVALSLAGCGRAPASARLPRPPARRVVSLAPNLTEIVFAVGAGSSLVGVSDFSDYPPAAAAVPRVGGLDPSAERIVSLRPDVVLVTADGGNPKGVVAALEAAGIPILIVPGRSLDDVLAGIRLVGARVGREEDAERLVRRLAERRAEVIRGVTGKQRPRAVLLVWPEPPQAAGGKTFLDDVLTEAGADNQLAGRTGWPVVSGEWLATAPLDVVVVPDSPGNRPVFDRAFASGALSHGTVARARIVRVDESTLTRPGPRVFDALEALARDLAAVERR